MLPGAGATRALHFRISKTMYSNQLTPRLQSVTHHSERVQGVAALEGQCACLTSQAAFPVNRGRLGRRLPVTAVSPPPTCRDGPVALPLVETFHRNVFTLRRRPPNICAPARNRTLRLFARDSLISPLAGRRWEKVGDRRHTVDGACRTVGRRSHVGKVEAGPEG